MVIIFNSLGCGIGYGYLHRIPTQRPDSAAEAPGTSPHNAPDAEPLLQVGMLASFYVSNY